MKSVNASGQLVTQQIGFERNNQFLFNHIDIALNAGEILELRGANGSGKSTLLRVLAGYIEPHLGSILWNDQPVRDILEDYQQAIHYLGHQNGIKPTLTVEENLRLTCVLSGKSCDSAALTDALKKTGLNTLRESAAGKLSAGQSRRLSLTRLLLQPAQLWFLDEPTTALDSHGEKLFAEMLTEHLANGGSAIVATHHELPLLPTRKTLWLGEQSHV